MESEQLRLQAERDKKPHLDAEDLSRLFEIFRRSDKPKITSADISVGLRKVPEILMMALYTCQRISPAKQASRQQALLNHRTLAATGVLNQYFASTPHTCTATGPYELFETSEIASGIEASQTPHIPTSSDVASFEGTIAGLDFISKRLILNSAQIGGLAINFSSQNAENLELSITYTDNTQAEKLAA